VPQDHSVVNQSLLKRKRATNNKTHQIIAPKVSNVRWLRHEFSLTPYAVPGYIGSNVDITAQSRQGKLTGLPNGKQGAWFRVALAKAQEISHVFFWKNDYIALNQIWRQTAGVTDKLPAANGLANFGSAWQVFCAQYWHWTRRLLGVKKWLRKGGSNSYDYKISTFYRYIVYVIHGKRCYRLPLEPLQDSTAMLQPVPTTPAEKGLNPIKNDLSRIVSSEHLVSPRSPELSEFEFGLIIAGNAFGRWITRCMQGAGVKDMTETEVLVLHHVAHRQREKRLADICFVLNIEDTHVVSYALKKLAHLDLVTSARRGKEVFWAANDAGQALCEKYRQVREACLMPGFSGAPEENDQIADLARLLRTLSGRYDQGARAASSI